MNHAQEMLLMISTIKLTVHWYHYTYLRIYDQKQSIRNSTTNLKNHFSSSPIILYQICKRTIEIVLSKTFMFVDVDNFFSRKKRTILCRWADPLKILQSVSRFQTFLSSTFTKEWVATRHCGFLNFSAVMTTLKIVDY